MVWRVFEKLPYLGDLKSLITETSDKRFLKLFRDREKEVERIKRAIPSCFEEGSGLILSGKPGVGKTNLLEYIYRRKDLFAGLNVHHNNIILTNCCHMGKSDLPGRLKIDFNLLEGALISILEEYLKSIKVLNLSNITKYNTFSKEDKFKWLFDNLRYSFSDKPKLVLIIDDIDHFQNDDQLDVLSSLIPYYNSPNIITILSVRPPVANYLSYNAEVRISSCFRDIISINPLPITDLLQNRFREVSRDGKMTFPFDEELLYDIQFMADDDNRLILQIIDIVLESLSEYTFDNTNGRYVISQDDIIDMITKTKPGLLNNIFKNNDIKRDVPIYLYLLQLLRNNRYFDSYLVDKLGRYGFRKIHLDRFVEELEEWRMIEPEVHKTSRKDLVEYHITQKGQYYSNVLATSLKYQQYFGGEYSDITKEISEYERFVNAIIEFIINDVNLNSKYNVNDLYNEFKRSSHSVGFEKKSESNFSQIIKHERLGKRDNARRGIEVSFNAAHLKSLADTRGIRKFSSHKP
jgi:hypothetical protein